MNLTSYSHFDVKGLTPFNPDGGVWKSEDICHWIKVFTRNIVTSAKNVLSNIFSFQFPEMKKPPEGGMSRGSQIVLQNLGMLAGIGIMLTIALFEDKIKVVLPNSWYTHNVTHISLYLILCTPVTIEMNLQIFKYCLYCGKSEIKNYIIVICDFKLQLDRSYNFSL